MDLSSYSAKKIVAKVLGVPASSVVLLRLGGWVSNVDSPAFQNGIQNTPDYADYDAAFPQTSGRFMATVAMKAGNTVGRDFNIEIDKADIDAMIAAGETGEFDL
jgi:hypothetical protein